MTDTVGDSLLVHNLVKNVAHYHGAMVDHLEQLREQLCGKTCVIKCDRYNGQVIGRSRARLKDKEAVINDLWESGGTVVLQLKRKDTGTVLDAPLAFDKVNVIWQGELFK